MAALGRLLILRCLHIQFKQVSSLYSDLCLFVFVANAKRLDYVKSVCTAKPTLPYVIRRKNIFSDVLDLFENEKSFRYGLILKMKLDMMLVGSAGICLVVFGKNRM